LFDDPMRATLFKRRPAAKAIQALLRRGVHIVKCKVDEAGVLVLSSLAARTVRGRRLATVPSWWGKKGTRKAG
jgi:basic membrane lipoprotein Med (substrate-binding protein (PBP1-ABC) superfamily)